MNPTVRERELGARLRHLRNGLGLTIEEVAAQLRCSAATMRRIESGARRTSLGDIRRLCLIYGVSDQEAAELADLSRQAHEPSWWTHYEDLRLSPYIGLEHNATSIAVFTMYWVPALMQTEAYARAVIKGIARKIEPIILQSRIEARLKRQDLLGREQAPRYEALLDEAVLHRRVGGPSVMVDQLDNMLRLARDGKVIIRVIPFDAGAHASADSNFEFLEFGDSGLSPVVFVEGLYSNSYQERPEEVGRYREAIEYLEQGSLGPQDSVNLIADIRNAHAKAASS